MFDFDATLPLMAVQFMVLVFLLNAVFYKPLTKVLEDRAEVIRSSQTGAKEGIDKINALTAQYEKELMDSRRQYQAVIGKAQAEAQKTADDKVAAAQAEGIAAREQAKKELDVQKQTALTSLETQVESLSREILDKLLVGI
jgi:F-type H+-transporting ATPase subunit b